MNHPYIRVGMNHVCIGSDAHMGMLSYFSTDRVTKTGVSFRPIKLDEKVSIGQCCVFLSCVNIEQYATVGT